MELQFYKGEKHMKEYQEIIDQINYTFNYKGTTAKKNLEKKLKQRIEDKWSIADTMRKNLASDITEGRYGLKNVTKQMLDIEDYEFETAQIEKAYEEFKQTL